MNENLKKGTRSLRQIKTDYLGLQLVDIYTVHCLAIS